MIYIYIYIYIEHQLSQQTRITFKTTLPVPCPRRFINGVRVGIIFDSFFGVVLGRFWEGFGVPNGHQNHEKAKKTWLEAHVCFVVDFNEVFYGSGDSRTTGIRCFVYTKHHFSGKAPIDFKLEF